VVLYGFMGKTWEYMGIPSGNLTVCELEHGLFEIVGLPMKNGDFP